MTKSTITREQLEEWVAQFDEDGGCDATDRQLEALIRQSLAAMDSDPVGWTDEAELRDVEKDGCGYLFKANPITPHADPRRVILLYRHAQPAPVVPDGYVMVPKDVSPEQLRAFQLNTKIGAYVTANWSDAYDSLRELWDVAIAHCPKIKTMD